MSEWYNPLKLTPIIYWGGKSMLAKSIIESMPAHDHYCEPFCGGGAIFWHKKPAKVNTLNDLNSQLINLWKTLADRRSFNKFIDIAKASPFADDLFEPLKNLSPMRIDTKPNPMEAFKFWYAYANSFTKLGESLAYGKSYRCRAKAYANRIDFLVASKEAIFAKLKYVQIMKRDALDIIKRMDNKNTLFYIDPPYLNAEHGGYYPYSNGDFKSLIDLLANGLQGKFIMSHYPFEAPKHWRVVNYDKTYMYGKHTKIKERLFMNF